jgi:hypothetical protein
MATNSAVRIAEVRAIPMPGHKRRWCGMEKWVEDRAARPNPSELHGLPWPETPVKVRIVDEPPPFDPNANGGVPVAISPKTLTMLERDSRIAVRVLGGGEGGDPAEVVRLKATLAEAEKSHDELRRELASLSERYGILHSTAQKQAEETGAKLAAVEQELAAARAQLAARATSKTTK